MISSVNRKVAPFFMGRKLADRNDNAFAHDGACAQWILTRSVKTIAEKARKSDWRQHDEPTIRKEDSKVGGTENILDVGFASNNLSNNVCKTSLACTADQTCQEDRQHRQNEKADEMVSFCYHFHEMKENPMMTRMRKKIEIPHPVNIFDRQRGEQSITMWPCTFLKISHDIHKIREKCGLSERA